MWANMSANGDPVVMYSSVQRVANPEPLSISEIKIVHEQLNVTHVDGYNCFDVTYHFKNESGKDFPEIHYGFPIDYLVSDEQETFRMENDHMTESIYETGWNDGLIKDVSFVFDGRELPCHCAKESVREAGYEVEIYDGGEAGDSIPTDAVNRRWFYTRFSMKPRSEARFNVRYKVYANSRISLYGDRYGFSLYPRHSAEGEPVFNHPLAYRYFATQFTILYDFTPARHFGNGEPYVLDVDIDFSNLNSPVIAFGDYECSISGLGRNHYVWTQELKPINLTICFSGTREKEDVERKIEPFLIPGNKYVLHKTAEQVVVDFHEPAFVSDLACDIDTAQIQSIDATITYLDGRERKYRYERAKEHTGFWAPRVQAPVLLTVTDLYHDGMGWSEDIDYYANKTGEFDNEEFKIKNITLHFNIDKTVFAGKSPFGGIRPLDTRFVKLN